MKQSIKQMKQSSFRTILSAYIQRQSITSVVGVLNIVSAQILFNFIVVHSMVENLVLEKLYRQNCVIFR